MTLANDIAQELDNAIRQASGEIGITKQFINNLSQLSTTPDIKIETGFCHQKPYAHFVKPPRYAGKQKCELGDILWIYKALTGGIVTEHRVTFSQIKHSKTPIFKIAQHQYEFLLNINSNSFHFGKTISTNAGFQPIQFNALTRSAHFSNYLFLGPTLTPKCECTKNLMLSSNSLNTSSLGTFELYIQSFLQKNSFGMNILYNQNGRILTDIVCKRVGLTLDPQEEWEDYFEDDGAIFGVVRITDGEKND